MSNKPTNDTINNIHNPEQFRALAHKTVDMLADYLEQVKTPEKCNVINYHKPNDLLQVFQKKVANFQQNSNEDLEGFMKDIVDYSTHLHSPNYIAHQTTAPLPIAALVEFITSLLNSSTACYEVGPVGSVIEKIMIDILTTKFGFNKQSGGFFALGGSIANVTALLAAREIMSDGKAWEDGNPDNFSLMVSDQTHYCVSRAINIMGLSTQNIRIIPSTADCKVTLDSVIETYDTAIKAGKNPKILALSACSTAAGIIEINDLAEVAAFCKEKNIWLHIDGAHGGPTVYSEKYKDLMKNYNLADSIVFDFHKMMLVPSVSTAILFKNGEHSYKAVSHNAPYLYKNNTNHPEDWFNISKRTMECTKPPIAIKALVPLLYYGEDFFDQYITYTYDLAKEFSSIIEESDDFEIFIKPETNIFCFRYLGLKNDKYDIDNIQELLYQKILENQEFYIVMTVLKGCTYLRVTIINPRTTVATLRRLLDHIRETAPTLF